MEHSVPREVKVFGTGIFLITWLFLCGLLITRLDELSYVSTEHLLLMGTFVLLIAAAGKFPLVLTSKVMVVVDTSLIYAAMLLFPPPLAGIVIGLGGILGHLLSRTPLIDLTINSSTTALSATVAQAGYILLGGQIPPEFTSWTVAIPLTGAAFIEAFMERVIISIVLSLHFGASIWPTFTKFWQGALREEVALYLLGLLTVLVVLVYPWGLLLTAIPVALVYLSLRNSLRLQVVTRDAVEKMVDVIDRRDPYTAGHSIRVADLSARIAMEMGLPWEEVQTIRAAARVHDLGKIEIDSVVLNKPGRLDDKEWELMRRHPIVGAEIIARFPEFTRGADYIRYHHERWDGRGYPHGLRGEEIPLGARIIAVADSYDAMITDRPYRRGLSRDVVLAELRKGAGVQWDPEVVAAFLRVLEKEEEAGTGDDTVPVPA